MTTIGRALSALLLTAGAGCNFLVDSNAKQCTQDSDCAQFGSNPLCDTTQGVCVAGPPGCVAGTPGTQTDYLNACTTSKFETYNNCNKLNLQCQGGANQSLPDPTAPMQGVSGASVIPPDPMNLCTDNAPTTGTTPNMIWLFGSSDFGPQLAAAQPSLSALTTPYRAVFQSATSCNGVAAIFGGPTKMKDPAPGTGGWAFYFDGNGAQVNCRIEPPTTTPVGVNIDIGISDLYAQTCAAANIPGTNVGDYIGPVVPFVLAVKSQSPENSISTEAAHLVFANGGHAPPPPGTMKDAMPWTDYHNYYIRNSKAGSTVLTALLIGVPPAAFWGIDRVTTDNLRDGLLAAMDTPSSAAIGVLSIDFYDKNRGNLKALYLQSKNQLAGFLPDSGPTTFDKANVRDGHYPLWGYVHMFTALNGGTPTSAAAQAMVVLFTKPGIDQTVVDGIIGASLTPQCAMKVQRSSEIGDFTARTGFQCGCYFDFKTKGKTDCQKCSTAEDCPGQHACRYGYCELNDN